MTGFFRYLHQCPQVSEEIKVEIHTASDVADAVSRDASKTNRLTPNIVGKRVSDNAGSMSGGIGDEPPTTTADDRRSNGPGGPGIEMRTLQVAEVRTKVHAGGGVQTSNVEAERVNDVPTFVDELFTICIEGR